MRKHVLREEFELVGVARVPNAERLRTTVWGEIGPAELIDVHLKALFPNAAYASHSCNPLRSAELHLVFEYESEAREFLEATVGENFTMELTKYTPNYPEGEDGWDRLITFAVSQESEVAG